LICHGCIVKLPLSSCRRHVNCSVVVFTSCCFLVGNSTEREEGSVADTKATEALVPIVCHSPSSIGTVGGNGRQTRCVVARLGRDCGAIVFLSSLAPRFIQCVNVSFLFLVARAIKRQPLLQNKSQQGTSGATHFFLFLVHPAFIHTHCTEHLSRFLGVLS